MSKKYKESTLFMVYKKNRACFLIGKYMQHIFSVFPSEAISFQYVSLFPFVFLE